MRSRCSSGRGSDCQATARRRTAKPARCRRALFDGWALPWAAMPILLHRPAFFASAVSGHAPGDPSRVTGLDSVRVPRPSTSRGPHSGARSDPTGTAHSHSNLCRSPHGALKRVLASLGPDNPRFKGRSKGSAHVLSETHQAPRGRRRGDRASRRRLRHRRRNRWQWLGLLDGHHAPCGDTRAIGSRRRRIQRSVPDRPKGEQRGRSTSSPRRVSRSRRQPVRR